MNSKFYFAKSFISFSIALCSINCISLAKCNSHFPQIRYSTDSKFVRPDKGLGQGKNIRSWKPMSGDESMDRRKSSHKNNVSLLSVNSSCLVDVNRLSYFVDDENSCARVVGLSQNSDASLNEFSKNPIRIESSIPYDGKNYSVTSIDDSCFEGCSDLTSIVIPNSIEKIGARSFAGSSLKYIAFESGSKINSIGESAFENSSIEFITLPQSLAFVDRSAFSNCENLSILMVENPGLNVSADSFNNCKNLSYVSIPCGMKKDIGYSGLKIGDANTFDVMQCSYSKFGLATRDKVGSGIIHWSHQFSDWSKVDGENSKKRTCALCNLAEFSVDNSERDTTSV